MLGGQEMLSINSSIYEIAKAHKSMKIKEIAFQIKINPNELKRVLAYLGFEYIPKYRKWSCINAKSNECLECSLWSVMEQMNNDNMNITDTEQQLTETNEITKSNTGNIEVAEFTQDEIIFLKQLAQQHMTAGTSGNVSDGSNDVLEAIKSVPTGSTSKKTFVIQDELIEQLDAFCEHHRIKKSDFLTLAIQDTLRKFSW